MIGEMNKFFKKQFRFLRIALPSSLRPISGDKMEKCNFHLENSSYSKSKKMSLNFKFGNWKYKKKGGAINYLASDTILVGQLETTMEKCYGKG